MNTNFSGLLKSDLISISDTAGGSFGIGKTSLYIPSEKSTKFKELAENRMSATLKGFQLISNLSNKNNYDYTAEQAKQIIDAIEIEVESLKQKFALSCHKRSTEFTLK